MRQFTMVFLGCAAILGTALPGCGDVGNGSENEQGAALAFQGKASEAPTSLAPTALASTPVESFKAPFTDGKRHFEEVKKLLRESYYTELDDDQLYRAAVQGMLTHVDPAMHSWNKLLSPKKLAAMKTDLAGSVVGVGVRIAVDEDTGLARVLSPLPESPAARAGVQTGDLLVRIDGESCQGWPLERLLQRIRGEAGTSIELTVLREGELMPLSLTRARVKLPAVTHETLPNQIGYFSLKGFHQETVPAAKAALGELRKAGVQGLVVDLRNNRGGALEHAVASADLLLPKGAAIVTIRERKGGQVQERQFKAETEATLGKLPTVVLTDNNTASGAEFVALALQTAGASLVGTTTRGKWSIQYLDKLDNDYGIKFTVGLMKGADGKRYEGIGLRPDLEVHGTPMEGTEPAGDRIARDPVLRTAHELLRTMIN